MDFNDWVALADILLKTIISGGVGWIGWLTYKTNSDKLKLDLYNRRLNLYTSAYDVFFTSILSTDPLSEENKAAALTFTKHASEAGFLFGRESEVFRLAGLFLDEMHKPVKERNYPWLLAQMSAALDAWLDFKDISKAKPSRFKLPKFKSAKL